MIASCRMIAAEKQSDTKEKASTMERNLLSAQTSWNWPREMDDSSDPWPLPPYKEEVDKMQKAKNAVAKTFQLRGIDRPTENQIKFVHKRILHFRKRMKNQ